LRSLEFIAKLLLFLLFFFSVFLWFFLLDQNMEMALGFEDSMSRTLASKRNLIHQEVFVPPVHCSLACGAHDFAPFVQ
jgi:hypothetical protein